MRIRAKKASSAPTHFQEDASDRNPPAWMSISFRHGHEGSRLVLSPARGTARRRRANLTVSLIRHVLRRMWTYPHGRPTLSSIEHIGNYATNIVSPLSHSGSAGRWTYPVEVRQEAPKVPARNRRTINTSKLLAPQQAALNAVNAVKVVQNMIRRPKTSEHGAHINGPTTKPRTKPDVTVHEHV